MNLYIYIIYIHIYVCACLCDALHDLILEVTLFHGCFSRFLNCTNGTKSRKTSHMCVGGIISLVFSINISLMVTIYEKDLTNVV